MSVCLFICLFVWVFFAHHGSPCYLTYNRCGGKTDRRRATVRAVLCDVIIPNFTSLSSISPKGLGRVSRMTRGAEDISTTDIERETRGTKLN